MAQFALQDVLKGPQAPKERRARGTVSSDASCRVAATKVLVNIARGIIKEKPHDNEAKLPGNMCINNLIKILKVRLRVVCLPAGRLPVACGACPRAKHVLTTGVVLRAERRQRARRAV